MCSVRGSLNSIMDPAMNSGVMLSFLLGKYLNVVDQAKFLLIVPVVFVALAVFMPQTPDYWVQRNKRKVKSVIWSILDHFSGISSESPPVPALYKIRCL